MHCKMTGSMYGIAGHCLSGKTGDAAPPPYLKDEHFDP